MQVRSLSPVFTSYGVKETIDKLAHLFGTAFIRIANKMLAIVRKSHLDIGRVSMRYSSLYDVIVRSIK